MDVFSDRDRYPNALLFAAEVTDALTRPAHGDHGVTRLRSTYDTELWQHRSSWSWCDNDLDMELVATEPLRATVAYMARRYALSPISPTGTPATLWPDVNERLSELYTALEFAAGTAEKAHQTELDTVLRPWIRNRLSSLLEPPGDSEDLHHFEQRVRHAVVICNRYRDTQYELFGDRHWNGKPEPKWICPDTDIALLAPFDGYCKGHAPTYALQLQEPQGATFTVVNFYRTAPISYVIALKPTPQLPKELATDPLCSQAVHDGLLALGITMKQPSTETEQQCPHQWPTHD